MSELERLRSFAQDIVRQGHDAGDIDGCELQDLAEKHGLLEPVEVAEPCDPEFCLCAEVGDFPTTCYRKTALLLGQPAPPEPGG